MLFTASFLCRYFLVSSLIGCATFAAHIAEDEVGHADEVELQAQIQKRFRRETDDSSAASSPNGRDRPEKARGQSSIASNRLMKELQKIHKSDLYKRGIYSVELVDDNLFEWRVILTAGAIDADSKLHQDLVRLNTSIELRFTFGDDFPFSAPFVRMIRPLLYDGYVLKGGALCMYLLSPQGWNSAYKIETVIMQIAVSFVELPNKVTSVDPKVLAEAYSHEKAVARFAWAMNKHQWNLPATEPEEAE